MATGSTIVSVGGRPQSSSRKTRDKNGGKEVAEGTTKPRPYQLELLDASLNENTIVNLGTGTGKTFIAVILIRELSYQIMERFRTDGAQRTVFLVNTVPLVHQQSSYIKNHTHLEVGEYTGDMNVDSWLRDRWLREFDKHHVLVMTRAIFLNLLLRGFVHLRQINLIVFDECHHAVKNDDYVQIMKVFDSCKNDIEVPRLLGLTASLIPSKCKPGDLEKKIKALEETLRCRSQTAKDMVEVAKYATNPVEKTLHYSSSGDDRELRRILEDPLNFLNSFKKEQKTRVYEFVKLHLDDGLHILENLGIWCAHDFATQALQDIERVVDEAKDVESRWENSLLHLGRTHLQIFVEKSDKKLKANWLAKVPITPKVQALLRHLGDSGISDGEVNVGPTKPQPAAGGTRARKKSVTHLLGIIFVERRTTAALLTKLLMQKSRDDPDLRHIKCEYIVGHNAGKGMTYVRREAHMSVKKQNEILEKFRKEKLNLLVATSVVEEGVDVPKCNLVVRFDFPQNLRSYIQSKGRARAKESTYLILIEGKKEAEVRSQLSDYRELEEELKRLCHNRDVPGEEDILKRMEEKVSPYMPFGIEAGTRATLSSSLPLIHRYCQKLPSDRYTILTPIFKTEKRSVLTRSESCRNPTATIAAPLSIPGQEFEYRSTLTLPMSCPVRTEIEGDWMPTSRIADKSAALEGIKQLHKAGELDNHLVPISKSMDSDEEDVAKMEEKRKPNAGTEKRAHDYPNEVAPSLTNCFPISGPGNHLYVFVVHDAETGNVHLGFPDENYSHTALGILTRNPLPHLKIPEFSLYDGEKEVYVRVHKYHSLVAELNLTELEILRQCHKTIFTEILGVRATWLQPEFENAAKNYLIVPLGFLPDLDPMEAYIDLDLASKVAEMGSRRCVSEQPIEWPCKLEVFTNALVTGIHCPPKDRRLYEVVCVNCKTTPRSCFPDPERAASFAEYFEKKYRHSFHCLEQPALECKPVGISASRIRLITSRFKTTEGEDLKQFRNVQKSEIILFPEICTLYPLPANFWKLARCLPSILWRVECILLMDAFRSAVASDTGIGLICDGCEVTTHTTLRGYKDYGFGLLETQQFITTGKSEEVHILTNSDVPLRGPDNALILQAMTPKKANDSINLERLETLGDSFLKLTTSVFLFCDRPHAHEGRLTSARSRRVGNLNLCSLAKQEGRDVTGKILSTGFEPREMWIPPCFFFNKGDPYLMEQRAGHASTRMPEQQRHYLYHHVTDKGVADCAEALIGAYLVSGGIEAGLRFTKWMGVKITKGESCSAKSTAEDASPKPPRAKRLKPSLPHGSLTTEKAANSHLFFRNSSSILSEYFGPHPPTVLSVRQQLEVQRLLTVSSSSRHELHSHKIEKVIDWTFQDPSLLLQALTHASYTKNRVTDCYQRLEFLGDAVLDYLITCNIYSTFPNYGPGEITGMRSALVNNITFAELAIQLELHKALLHNSPALFRQIPQYIEALKKLSPRDGMMEEEEEENTTVVESSEILCRDQDDSGTATGSLPASEPLLVEEEDSDEEVEELDPPKVLGDLLESLAGAIFLDSGMDLETVWRVFSPLFQSKMDKFEGKIPVPPIQELFELEPNIQTKRSWKKGGRVRCMLTVVDRGIQVSAEASSHKAAKSAAARAALKKIKAQT